VKDTVFVCAGGTGGHVFPGLAVADALTSVADVECRFFGTARGLESRVVPERGYPLELLPVSPMKGGGPVRFAKGALSVVASLGAVAAEFRKYKPKAVVSVGGYSAGPASVFAVATGVPLLVIEPNAVPGFTHRALARFTTRAYVAWDEVKATFGGDRARAFGVPLRRGFVPRTYEPGPSRKVLVLGGSLGAQALNERLPPALGKVAKDVSGLSVVHQTGKDKEPLVRALYDRAGVANVRCVDFLDDVAQEIASSDLVVARAGAVTVAEIACLGRPSLLVPFPYAADDHQLKNALLYEGRGACRVVAQDRATVERLSSEITRVLADPELRSNMARAAQRAGRPDAAIEVACDVVELCGLTLRSQERGSTTGARRPREVH
jgi:UDP-N-acetylglucosamine--N-acetylmuramyl-(pentapeptide) pyrophosphoryl-undecaprenol N-acetylglucosamine transferase